MAFDSAGCGTSEARVNLLPVNLRHVEAACAVRPFEQQYVKRLELLGARWRSNVAVPKNDPSQLIRSEDTASRDSAALPIKFFAVLDVDESCCLFDCGRTSVALTAIASKSAPNARNMSFEDSFEAISAGQLRRM